MKKEISIDFVVDADLKDFKRTRASVGYNITCPFCGGKNKFNVAPTKNVARCAKCGNGNDPLKGFNAVSLHAKLTNLSYKEAYKDLCDRWEGLKSDVKVSYTLPKKESNKILLMPVSLRNEVYNELLKKTNLKSKHKASLLKRGLDLKAIEKNCYKSLATQKTKSLSDEVIKSLSPKTKNYIRTDHRTFNVVYAVPGFVNLFTKKQDMVKAGEGILIPVRNLLGEIEGFQIRHDKYEENFPKYTWFSSSGEKGGIGVSEINNIHHAGFDEYYKTHKHYPQTVTLTEGALKADVASFLSKKPFIAVMGVANLKKLMDELISLKNLGCKNLILAFDMDYRTKKEVKSSMRKCISIVKEAGLNLAIAEWDEAYKGIDDALLEKKPIKIKKLF